MTDSPTGGATPTPTSDAVWCDCQLCKTTPSTSSPRNPTPIHSLQPAALTRRATTGTHRPWSAHRTRIPRCQCQPEGAACGWNPQHEPSHVASKIAKWT